MKTVLVVDDSAIMRRFIRNSIDHNGFDVIGEADSGKVGVDKYIELKPDIVTMDVTMREMSGIEALQEIIKIDPDAKVMMISAMGQEIIVRDAIMLGAKGFIVKPFNDEQLISALKKA